MRKYIVYALLVIEVVLLVVLVVAFVRCRKELISAKYEIGAFYTYVDTAVIQLKWRCNDMSDKITMLGKYHGISL